MDDLERITARLVRIERANRWLKVTMAIVVLVTGLALFRGEAERLTLPYLKVNTIRVNKLEIANGRGKVWLSAGSNSIGNGHIMDTIEIEDTCAGMGTTTIKGGCIGLLGDTGSVWISLPGGVDPEITISGGKDGTDSLWKAP